MDDDKDSDATDRKLISSYTRSEALADGVLVDVTETAREAGFVIPIALTRAAWDLCVALSPAAERACNHERGRAARARACGPATPAQQEKSAARSDATASTVGFVVGGALIAGGLTLFLTAPSVSASGTRMQLVPTIGAGSGGLLVPGVRGGF